MEVLMSVSVGVLFFIGFYLILQGSLVRAILGIIFLGNATNMSLFSFSLMVPGGSAILGESGLPTQSYSDPLTQALILTAIVISLGFSLFFLVLALVAHPILGGDTIREDSSELSH